MRSRGRRDDCSQQELTRRTPARFTLRARVRRPPERSPGRRLLRLASRAAHQAYNGDRGQGAVTSGRRRCRSPRRCGERVRPVFVEYILNSDGMPPPIDTPTHRDQREANECSAGRRGQRECAAPRGHALRTCRCLPADKRVLDLQARVTDRLEPPPGILDERTPQESSDREGRGRRELRPAGLVLEDAGAPLRRGELQDSSGHGDSGGGCGVYPGLVLRAQQHPDAVDREPPADAASLRPGRGREAPRFR